MFYTTNQHVHDDPAFMEPPDMCLPLYPYKSSPHSSYYRSSQNQSEESGTDHLGRESADMEENDVQDVENAMGIAADKVEYNAQKKEHEVAKKKAKEAEKKQKVPPLKLRKGKRSKSGVNQCEKGGSDEEISQLDPKHIKNADIDPDKKMGHNWPHEDRLTLVKYVMLEKVWKDLKMK